MAAIDAEGAVRPFGADMGEEFPKSSDVLQMLTEAVRSRIADGRYRCAAICVDVAITVDGKKMDALRISVFDAGKEAESFYFSYTKAETGYTFEPIDLGEV